MRILLAAVMGVALTALEIGSPAHTRAQPPATIEEVATASTPDPVVLVVLDGVRWQDVFDGAANAPNLRRLGNEEGASLGAGASDRFTASGPNFVSLPSYREIFSGRAAVDCTDNECARITRATIVDELRAAGRSAAVFASWEKIDLAAAAQPEGVVISAGRGAAQGDPWPGIGAFRRDRDTGAAALRHLEAERPDFLFLGLGEPDEFAHHGDREGYLAAIHAADAIIGELQRALARLGERGRRTHLFVTTDHGRSDGFRDHGAWYPESARVWLVASGPRIRARGAVRTARAHQLRDVAPTLRAIVGLPRVVASGGGAPIATLFVPNAD